MIPWVDIDATTVPGDGTLMELRRRGDEFVIRVGGVDLMSSRMFSSEEALAERAIPRLREAPARRILVGGLGMGFTTAAALRCAAPTDEVITAELVPSIVAWNRTHIGHLAGHPLDDPRARIHLGDVGALLRQSHAAFDAILLDVDNGPDSLTLHDNDGLYSARGLRAAMRALRPGGVLGVWSAFDDPRFTRRLKDNGFDTELVKVRSHKGRGQQHYLWFATSKAATAR